MNPASFIASAGGTGYAPKAPGTFGSLVGLAIGVLLLKLGHGPLFAGIIVTSLLGLWAVWACGGQNDPGWIVIDEVAGQLITMLALPRIAIPGPDPRLRLVPPVRHRQAGPGRLGRSPPRRPRRHGR